MFSDVGTISKITFSDEYSGVGRLEFVLIPEPCFLSLYAVGMLFLARRKRTE